MTNAVELSQISMPAINHYQMMSAEQTLSCIDGNKIGIDSSGRIDQVEYVNGCVIRRHESYVLVRSESTTLWFGDYQGRWFILD